MSEMTKRYQREQALMLSIIHGYGMDVTRGHLGKPQQGRPGPTSWLAQQRKNVGTLPIVLSVLIDSGYSTDKRCDDKNHAFSPLFSCIAHISHTPLALWCILDRCTIYHFSVCSLYTLFTVLQTASIICRLATPKTSQPSDHCLHPLGAWNEPTSERLRVTTMVHRQHPRVNTRLLSGSPRESRCEFDIRWDLLPVGVLSRSYLKRTEHACDGKPQLCIRQMSSRADSTEIP